MEATIKSDTASDISLNAMGRWKEAGDIAKYERAMRIYRLSRIVDVTDVRLNDDDWEVCVG